MKTTHKLTLATIAALGLGLASTAAFTAPGMGWCDGPGMGPRGHMRGDPEQRMQKMQAFWAERMEELRTKLKLTPDQEVAWKAFTAAQTAQHQAMADHWQRLPQAKTNTVEHFNTMIQFMEDRLAGMKAVAGAANELYKDLSPEQKTIMDDFFASRRFHGGGPRAK